MLKGLETEARETKKGLWVDPAPRTAVGVKKGKEVSGAWRCNSLGSSFVARIASFVRNQYYKLVDTKYASRTTIPALAISYQR